jgi:Mn2+/Fe2+ NRAMP family transporter
LSGAGFPGALKLVSGNTVATLFALGLVEAGAVAILTISASTGYAVGECIGVAHSFNNSTRKATVFYGANVGAALVAAAIILIPGAPLLSIALNANVLATVLLPVALVFLIMLANDRELMGKWANTAVRSRIALAIVAFISICGAAYGIDSFLQVVHIV